MKYLLPILFLPILLLHPGCGGESVQNPENVSGYLTKYLFSSSKINFGSGGVTGASGAVFSPQNEPPNEGYISVYVFPIDVFDSVVSGADISGYRINDFNPETNGSFEMGVTIAAGYIIMLSVGEQSSNNAVVAVEANEDPLTVYQCTSGGAAIPLVKGQGRQCS